MLVAAGGLLSPIWKACCCITYTFMTGLVTDLSGGGGEGRGSVSMEYKKILYFTISI